MKKTLSGILAVSMVFSLLVSALTISASAGGAGTVVYRNSQQIADNLTYTNTIHWTSEQQRQENYALTLSGPGDAYPIVMACDTMYGRFRVDEMIAYAESQGRRVLGAVNTDFFAMQNGVPLGLVVENGVYKSSPEGHNAVGFRPDGSVVFSENTQITITLTNNGNTGLDGYPPDMTNAGQTTSLTHFNKYRVDGGGMYLFSSAFSTVSTRTSTPGWFVRFRILEGAPSVSGTMTLLVEETLASDTEIPIGDEYLVLTAADASCLGGEFAKFKPGDRVTLTTTCSDPALNDAAWATGGGDYIIKNGAMTDPNSWDKALLKKNPRTALGVTADGALVVLVADGREVNSAAGLTLQSLAEEMVARNCVTAINLDGGGSSVMSLRLPGQSNCTVVNRPSDGAPRKVSTYLLFVTDAAPDGQPRHLGLVNEGFEVLAGSSVDLSFLATDSGYMPVTPPSDIQVTSQKGLGTIVDGKYVAGPVHGVDYLTLTSPSTGAVGTATVHIIYDPTKLTVTKNGETTPLTSLTAYVGDAVQLNASAFYYGLPVNADPEAKIYTVEGDIGTVDPTGLFTAAGGGGITGSITVSIGGCSLTIPVTVTGFTDVEGHWARAYIRDLSLSGVVNGVSDTLFAPENTIKRGDFVLMLWRAAGKPAPAAPTTFTDVLPEDYYAEAIAWAEAQGIAKGTGEGIFNPQGTLTREQAFTLVYRSMAVLGKTYPDASTELLAGFADGAAVSEWARVPTSTLISLGVVSGANGALLPADAMTRAQMAKILDTVIKLPKEPVLGQTDNTGGTDITDAPAP